MNKNIVLDFKKIKNLDNNSNYIIGSHRACYKILNNDYKRSIFLKEENNKREIIKTSNVLLFSNNEDKKYIDEDVVILDVFPHYSHLIVDMLSKFLYIKKHNKNVKAVFVDTQNDKETYDQKMHRKNFNEIFKKLKDVIEIKEYIHSDNQSSYFFKNVYSISHKDTVGYQRFSDVDDSFLSIRKMFIPKRNSKNNRNIFISRKDDFSKRIENIKKLETYFEQKNYELCFLENMSFQEQVELFYDAKNIAAVNGCSLTNLLFANTLSSVMSINSDPDYYASEWRYIAKKINIGYVELYLSTDKINPAIKMFDVIDGLFQK
jgi:capsular polysaccharide biosynthesis protein